MAPTKPVNTAPPQRASKRASKGASKRAPPLTPGKYPPGLKNTMDKEVVEQVEVLTRGQWKNRKWFNWRRNRITAVIAHSVAHCKFVNGKSTTLPQSLIKEITDARKGKKTDAMKWGLEMEPEAKESYEELKSAELGRPVSVQDCGLFIDPERTWLGATPDGIVTDSETDERLLCLEVMCPYKHMDSRVEDACRKDRDFCLEIQEGDEQQQEDGQGGNRQPPSYRLKPTHPYYTQVQCQLAVTGLKKADFVVYTNKETAIAPVTFDAVLWEDTVTKLEMFYQKMVQPTPKEKQQQ